MMQSQLIIGFIILSFLFSCQSGKNQSAADLNLVERVSASDVLDRSSMPEIDKSLRLEQSLYEISGLTYDASANVLIAHDDELGILYFIDFENGKVESKLKIGDIGDYEGVELIDDKVFLINSAGQILEHTFGVSGSKKISTVLNANNNVEGLALRDGELLIACKGKAEYSSEQNYNGAKAIYTYSLATSKMSEEPSMLFDFDKFNLFFDKKITTGEAQRLKSFAPSGIAIHPSSKDIYILSHKGKLLVVCNAQSEIKEIYFLDQQDHRQPEGICFDTSNRMYIANEGNKSAPVIHRYQF